MNTETHSQEYARLIDLQVLFTKTSDEIDQLDTRINDASNKLAAPLAPDYVVLTERKAQCDAEIQALLKKNPQWEGKNKSVKTPFGEVGRRTVTALEIPNPAMTVVLMTARGTTDPAFKPSDFLYVEESPAKEALERLSNEDLTKLGVTRTVTESITVKPAKINVSKVVNAAKQQSTK